MTSDSRPPATDDLEGLLDRAIGAARSGPAPELTAAAKDRVRARIFTHETAADSPCATLRPQVAALLAGTLPEDRAALVDDHCRECVPCRRTLVALRDGASPAPAPAPPARAPRRRLLPAVAAAAATVALAVTGALLLQREPGSATQATVAEVDGSLLVADTGASLPAGAAIAEGVAVRTARGSRAVVTLPDGSRVELNERAQLAYSTAGDALTVDLSRGDIIFEAAKRKQRDLFVTTDDCTVAVKGTIFTVRDGLKGSRVGVLEGSVHVQRQGRTSVLGPGEQAATDPSLEPQSLDEQVAWSLDKDRWEDVLNEIAAAARAVEADGRTPNPRHESAILAAMPDSTVLFAAMPNDGDMARLAEEISERVSGNPRLRDWWQAQLDPKADRANFAVMLDAMRRLSDSLGEEVVFALLDDDVAAEGGPRPVLAAGVRDEDELRSLIADLAPEGHAPRVLTARELDGVDSGEMLLVIDHGHVLASPSRDALRDIVSGFENGALHSTGFLADLEGQYDEGAELLIAADLARVVARRAEAAARRAASEGRAEPGRLVTALGIPDIDRFVLTAGHDDPGTAVLSFRGDRSGIAAWLAEPGPMGSLDFVTPEATFAVSALFQDPQRMLADLQSMVPDGHLEHVMDALTDDRGAVLHEELAASLGGEMALALDGPVLPQPSWKLVLEVDDPARLDAALEGLARVAASHANAPADVALVRDERTTEGPARALRLGSTEIHYAIRDGYMVATPSLALLEAALMAHARGTTLASSPRLLDLLPGGERDGLSLLAWQDASRLLGQLPKGASLLPDGAGQLLTTAAAGGAAVGWARASDRAIVFGMNAPGGGLGTGLASLVRSSVVQALAHHALTVTPASGDDAGAPAHR